MSSVYLVKGLARLSTTDNLISALSKIIKVLNPEVWTQVSDRVRQTAVQKCPSFAQL